MSLPPDQDPTSIGSLAKLLYDAPTQEVQIAAKRQREGHRVKMGQCLVEQRALSAQQLAELIERQQALRDGVASIDDVTRVVDYVTEQTRQRGSAVADLARQALAALRRR